VLLAMGLATACQPKEIPFRIQIVTQSCDPLLDPFESVNTVQVRVFGDGIQTPLEVSAPASQSNKQISIPNIPAGTNRVVEVRAFSGDGISLAQLKSLGRTAPFDVPTSYPTDRDPNLNIATVFLRRTNRLTPVSSAQNPKVCETMRLARSGHTATLLQNGKVFIAGGYGFRPETTDRLALSETEFYNPLLGVFETGKELSVDVSGLGKIPRAFQTATRLLNGQVLLWGGEVYQGAGDSVTAAATTTVVLYDPDTNQYRLPRQSVGTSVRSRHLASIDRRGRVLIVGGTSKPTLDTGDDAVPSEQIETYDPDSATTDVVTQSTLPRLGAAVVYDESTDRFLVVGGAESDTAMATRIVAFQSTDSGLEALPLSLNLPAPGRRKAGAAIVGDQQLVVLGGYGSPVASIPLPTTDTVDLKSGQLRNGPPIGNRTEMCIVKLPTGNVWAFGGRTSVNSNLVLKPDESSIIVSASSDGQVLVSGGPEVRVARYEHTCTLLPDGTVLVTGGRGGFGPTGVRPVLQDAYIFQPGPSGF
jgi:hypothetical protein